MVQTNVLVPRMVLGNLIHQFVYVRSVYHIFCYVTTITVVQCGSLSNPTNGQVEYSTTSYRSISNYYCNYGYVLVGVNSRQCLSNGTWSMEPPICFC